MILSVYATDEADVRDAVVDQAHQQHERTLFTSLHMPEIRELAGWVAWMGRVHRDDGLRFWADVSPASFEALGWRPGDLAPLREAGVVGLRLDYGFGVEEISRIAGASGGAGALPVAVNASTASRDELDALAAAGLEVVGWHNFYPRPGTGLTEDFLVSQSALFTERGLRVLAFVPGERARRAPLHLGLPTLERHRFRNAYVAARELADLVPGVEVVCAEGPLDPRHAELVRRAEDGILTLPLVDLAPGCDWLLDRDWDLRVEQTGVSQRLVGTRGHETPTRTVSADALEAGSLQMDTLARYSGEVHLMVAERPLDADHLRLADVAAPYRGLVRLLQGGETVRFERS